MDEIKKLIFLIGPRTKPNLMLKYMLINGGYKVLLIEQGPNILRYIEEELPSLLLFDFRVSDIEWFNLLKEIKQNNLTKMIPFAVLMNRSDREIVPKLYEQGADNVLYKSLPREDLLDEINGILIKSEKSQSNLLSKDGFEGNLKDMSIVEIIQTLDINEKTGILRISSADDVGYIYFYKGRMQKAKVLNLKDELAIFRILQWREGIFIFQNKGHNIDKTLKMHDREIVMEGMKRIDDIMRYYSEIGGETVVPHSRTIKDSSIFMDLTQLQKTIYLKLDGKKQLRDYIKYNSVGDNELLSSFMALYKKDLIYFKSTEIIEMPETCNKKRIKDIFKNVEEIFFTDR